MDFLTESDKEIIRTKLIPYFRINRLKIKYDNKHNQRHPDIWCIVEENLIVVTKEWRRQNQEERMKRITHELVHLSWGLEHGRIGNLVYSTYPSSDSYSRTLYQWIMRRSNDN